MFVSFVIHMKYWIAAVILLTVIFSVGSPFNKQTAIYSDSNYVYTFQADLIEKTYDKSAVEWYSILAQLQTDEYTKVLILYNDVDAANIVEKLKQFYQQEIILLSDDTLKKNQIKIIMEK